MRWSDFVWPRSLDAAAPREVSIGEASRTTLICGDAIPTQDHLEQGKVLPTCWNREKAQESFSEAVEIADLLILGRDNAVMNMTRRGV